jgi:dephospho-CoA kinase
VTRVGLTGGIGSGKSTVARLLAEFGDQVLAADGSLDRAALGEIVFADPGRRAALEAIVHPHVARRSAELMAVAPPGAVLVYDVPLLVEKQLQAAYDVVVVVDVGEDVQVERLVRDRRMDPDEARRRIAAQASRAERRGVADVVLTNEGEPADLVRQVDELWSTLPAHADGGDPA